MTKREEIVSVAESKVGLNRNEVDCGGDGAWCAMFVSYVLNIVGIGEEWVDVHFLNLCGKAEQGG